MQTGFKIISLSLFLTIALLSNPATGAADGTVAGTVGLEMEDGRVEPGNWIRVLLVTRAVEVPRMKTDIRPGNPGYVDTVNALHTGFYIQIQNHLAEEDYLFASTLTTDEGTFKIPAVAPGDYFVLVKLPASIRGYKVAWQIPVKVASGKTTTVNLNRSNLALPTAKR